MQNDAKINTKWNSFYLLSEQRTGFDKLHYTNFLTGCNLATDQSNGIEKEKQSVKPPKVTTISGLDIGPEELKEKRH